jgi:hypothetical protein
MVLPDHEMSRPGLPEGVGAKQAFVRPDLEPIVSLAAGRQNRAHSIKGEKP